MLAGMDAPADPQRSRQRSQPRGARPGRRSSALSAWMAQARRDARVLLDGLRGRHPEPLVPRRTRGHHAPARPSGTAETVHVHIGDRAYEIQVQPGESILDAALAAGLPMPFSCTLGGCGACKVTCHAGIVAMDEPSCLTPAERAAGHVLTCVGRPVGPVRIEVAPP